MAVPVGSGSLDVRECHTRSCLLGHDGCGAESRPRVAGAVRANGLINAHRGREELGQSAAMSRASRAAVLTGVSLVLAFAFWALSRLAGASAD